jgi:hypothetical protein
MSMRIALILAAAVAALAAPGLARADTVTEWNLNANTVLMGNLAQGPQAAVPHLAMIHGAVYDAVNAIDGSHEGYLLTTRAGAPFDSKEAAAATAAYKVLRSIVPDSQKALVDAQYAASLAGIADGLPKTRGIAVGEAAAAAMIAFRTADGRFGPPGFPLTAPGPGVWEPTLPAFVNDPNAWLRDVRPFLVESATQFRPEEPYPLTSRRYARDFDEVKSLGSATSTVRTAEQTVGARYWAENPAATWSRIFRRLSADHGLSLVENARLYAMLYTTGADSLITVWSAKGAYLFWRPITAIRRADTDDNALTEKDEAWTPLIPTPPYPEYPAGNPSLGTAMATTLEDFFGTDHVSWTDTNNGGFTRSFTRFSDAGEDVVGARIWSGIHFRHADEQGARIARQVAKWRERHYFGDAH